MSKGRKVPDQPIDHAAQLRDRLGRAAYEAAFDHEPVAWAEADADRRERYRKIGQAVMDVIVDRGARSGEFAVSSIYGYKNQKPYVNVEVTVSPMQMSPGQGERNCTHAAGKCRRQRK